ncbi:MAG: protoheme farnesyltransferase [Bacteroidota bacterium]|jgi:protoheme IX farnesyltransferase
MSTSTLKSYFQLVKFRLTSTVAATSAFGYMLGCQLNNRDHWKEAFEWSVFWAVLIGGMLVVFASNGLNQIIEKGNDSKMSRTATRPIVEERISLSEARIFSWVSGLLGLLLLAVFTPFATMLLSLLSLILYVFVYTPMKKVNSLAVMVGAIPGALPPLIGYTAAVGRIDEPGLMLFLVQFFWQFPHFWAIAWMLHDDYQKAGYWLLPSSGGRDKRSAYQILTYTVLLILVSMMPIYYGLSDVKALSMILPVGAFVLYRAAKLFGSLAVPEARKLMFASLLFTPVVFLAYIIF